MEGGCVTGNTLWSGARQPPGVLLGALITVLIVTGCHGKGNGCFCLPPTYGIGGTVNGLVGSRLTLQNKGAILTGIGYAANGAYPAFDYYLPGTTYNITVGTQPTNPSQTCVVANGMGTLGNSSVT